MLHGIGDTLEQVHETATSIAAAVEEQRGAMQEIARNVVEAACGTDAVTRSIREVQAGASRTGGASAEVPDQASALARGADAPRREVAALLAGIRAA
ncbi:Methyl-accepting chemotaxis protein [Methylobacterium crusticola]|uniref:Methyl-accepting chemotaxis protein n=1 Tax=Methylobacterium crusticola TaxID=1697972 RepID=A0ABQ4R3Q0_9HYPH|nr:hypothetical protein [Methylobacterium crusticola]GJD51456.1 Methyl-accepting chemotaxis protein [Methylobacterium crusticola]